MSEKIPKGGEFLIEKLKSKEIFTPEDFTQEQNQIAETTTQFIEKEVLPVMEKIDEQDFELI